MAACSYTERRTQYDRLSQQQVISFDVKSHVGPVENSLQQNPNRGGSSKSIDRGSDRVKGASGVFRMREKGTRGSGGRKSPSGVQGQSPGRGLGLRPPEAEAFLLMNA